MILSPKDLAGGPETSRGEDGRSLEKDISSGNRKTAEITTEESQGGTSDIYRGSRRVKVCFVLFFRRGVGT